MESNAIEVSFGSPRMSMRRGLVRRLNSGTIQRRWSPRRNQEKCSMKFMFIVKSAHRIPPTPALLEAMHKLANREIKAGRMLDNGGLMPMATGAQVRVSAGKLSIIDRPIVETQG